MSEIGKVEGAKRYGTTILSQTVSCKLRESRRESRESVKFSESFSEYA